MLMKYLLGTCTADVTCADPEGGRGSGPPAYPVKNKKAIDFVAVLVRICLKIAKLPSQL